MLAWIGSDDSWCISRTLEENIVEWMLWWCGANPGEKIEKLLFGLEAAAWQNIYLNN